MFVLTVVKNNIEYFLNSNGIFSSNFQDAIAVEFEKISDIRGTQYFRLRFNNQYITSTSGENLYLTEIKNDDNILFKHDLNDDLNFLSKNKYLSEENFTVCTKEIVSVRFFNLTHPVKVRHTNLLENLFTEGLVVLDFNMESLMYDDFNKSKQIVNNSSHKRISDILKIDPCFQRLLSHPNIVNFIDKIYKNKEYHVTTFSSNKVNKVYTESSWHIDYPYHNMGSNIPQETLGVQLLILLDDFTVDNGGTHYVEGSHKYCKFPNESDISSHPCKQLSAKRGSVVIWLGKLWHKEGISKVEPFRSALLANFSPLIVPAKDDVKSLFTFENNGLQLDQNGKLKFLL